MRLRLAVLLLLVPLGAGQDPGPDSASADAPDGDVDARALAPVQVIVDAVPAMVRLAFAEAIRDGTPDDAQALLASMLAFIDGLDVEHDFPELSAAARADLQTGLQYAARVARSLDGFPADAGDLYDLFAACDSWDQTATRAEAERWTSQGRAVVARLGAWEALLSGLADEALPGVDAAPLRGAARQVAAVRDGDAVRAIGCFTALEDAFGIEPPDPFVTLRLVPDHTWPTGSVRAIGALTGAGDRVVIAAPGLGVSIEAGAVFAVRIEVPLQTPLGVHEVTASAGAVSAAANLTVHQAPSWILVDTPRQVVVGSAFEVALTVRTPVPVAVGAGPVRLSGDADASLPLAASAGTSRLTAPDEPGIMRLRLDYDGSRVVAPSSVEFSIEVVQEAAVAAQQVARDEPARTPLGASPIGFPWPGLGWLDEVPWWLLLLAALLVVGLVAWALRRARRRRVQPSAPWTVPPPPALPGRGLVASIVAFMAWLAHLGRAPPGTTVREAAKETPGWRDLVEPFEQVRYGAATEPDQAAAIAPGRLERLLARLRGHR